MSDGPGTDEAVPGGAPWQPATARGRDRRRLLLDATIRVIAHQGVAAVTHRTVAAEAGVTKSSVTHHFASLDDLLTAALTYSATLYLDRLRDALDGATSTEALAAHLADLHNRDRARAQAEYEVYLMAARQPGLRPVVTAWTDFLAGFARRHTRDPIAILTFTSAIDGVVLDALVHDEPLNPHTLQAVMNQALHTHTTPRTAHRPSA